MNGYLAAQATTIPTANAVEQAHRLLDNNKGYQPLERVQNIVDMYLGASPANKAAMKASLEALLVDAQQALGAAANSIGEIGVLIDAN